MKSTPIPALLAEAGETTCANRQIWLGTKVILKNWALKNEALISEILTLYKNVNEGREYWEKWGFQGFLNR